MKRDMELVRKILFAIEASPNGYAPEIKIEGHEPQEVGYHVHLMIEAGLVKGTDATHIQSRSPQGRASYLTLAGHEFIDAARDDRVWNKTIARLKIVGGTASMDVLKKIMTAYVLRKLRLQ